MAQNNPGTKAALSAVATRGGKGAGSSAVAALVAQQQQSQAQMDKLLQTIAKLQEENAETVKQAAAAGAGAATQIANQVAQGIERAGQQSQRETERAEDKDFQRQQVELNNKLQADAVREAALMGADIQASRDKLVLSIKNLQEDDSRFRGWKKTYRTRLEETARSGGFDGPEGAKRLKKAFDLLEQATIFGDNMFSDKHYAAAFREHNERLNSISAGNDPFATMNMQTDPLNLPVPEVKVPQEKISRLEDLTPDQRFELKQTRGYPPNGLLFSKEENFGLPTGESPRVSHPSTLLALLVNEDIERNIMDKNVLKEYRRKKAKQLIVTSDLIDKMKKIQGDLNKAYNFKALKGAEAALEDYLFDDDPSKHNDAGRYITKRALVHTFGGGSKGEEMAQMGLEFFDGKREAKSGQDFALLAAVESASFNINFHLMAAFQNASDPTKGGSFATQLTKQLIDTVGRDEALRRFGVDPSSTELVDLQVVMQDLVFESIGMSGSLNQGMTNESIYLQFQDQAIANAQMIDLEVYRTTKEGERRRARVGEMIGEVNSPVSEGGPSVGQFQEAEDADTEFEESMSLTQAYVELYGGLGPNMAEEVSAVLTNEMDPVTSPNIKAYGDQEEVDRQRSPYSRAASDRARFPYMRFQKGQEASAKERKEQGDMMPVGEAFKSGGIPKIATEFIPPLVSMAAGGARRTIIGTARNVGQAVAGSSLTDLFDAGTDVGGGKLPLTKGGELDYIKDNLDPTEIQQIIRASNQGN